MSQIFLRALRHIIDPPDKRVQRLPFDIEYCTESGKIISGRVTCTSSNFANDTFNLKFAESGEYRKVHATLILKYNNKEVML